VSVVRFDKATFRWHGVDERAYKEGEGDFRDVVRLRLGSASELGSAFELRYFELEPGGYSSLEKHRHVHFVVALRGRGKAVVGDRVVELEPFDALYVSPLAPHRFVNEAHEPFGFLCPVDASRDRPQPLSDSEREALKANPATAPYVL
jgi:quercetin dioxygenase-like cupin family protein